MKPTGYTIGDEFLWNVLTSFSEELARAKIPYSLVGGVGVQARIANILSDKGKHPIQAIQGLDLLVRQTGDLDIATSINGDEEDSKLVTLFNTYSNLNQSFLVQPITTKALRVQSRTNPSSMINISLETNPGDFKGLTKSYDDIIKTSEAITLKKTNQPFDISVASPEYLVASKLTRLEDKDRRDIFNLLNCLYKKKGSFNYDFVETILKLNDKSESAEYLRSVHYDITKHETSK